MGSVSPEPDVTSRSPHFGEGRLVGIGSLPHRDAAAAAAFAMSEFDIATIPSLPRRSPAEGMVAQAIAGLPGVSLGQYGSFAVSPERLADDVPIVTDLGSDAFVGLHAFLDLARTVRHDGKPVKWQFVGAVTLGVALQRAGIRNTSAFAIAARAVRQHVANITAAVADALPDSPQLVVLDEPALVDLMAPDFPIPPDQAVDLISTSMAAASSAAADVTVGLHCCGPCDIATMLATGPQMISVPVSEDIADYAGYLARFLEDGGVIAWGVVPTDRPTGPSADRYWRRLSATWCALVERGLDPVTLRRQSLVSPSCGFANHQVSHARRLTRLAREVGEKVRSQASATRFALGA